MLGLFLEFFANGNLFDLHWIDYILTQPASGRRMVDRHGVLMVDSSRPGEKTTSTPGADGRIVDASRMGETLLDFHQIYVVRAEKIRERADAVLHDLFSD